LLGGFASADLCDDKVADCYAACDAVAIDAYIECAGKCFDKKIACDNDLSECISKNDEDYCLCKMNGGITLNTSVPFIGRCILLGNKNASGPNSTEVTQLSAFPLLMKALTNIALSLILVTSLIMIIAGGVMIASSGANSGGYDQGKKMIRKVII
jgi:hypothetical protein